MGVRAKAQVDANLVGSGILNLDSLVEVLCEATLDEERTWSRRFKANSERIATGDLIGLVGSTGRSTGPHLHYEVRRNGRAISPLPARKGL